MCKQNEDPKVYDGSTRLIPAACISLYISTLDFAIEAELALLFYVKELSVSLGEYPYTHPPRIETIFLLFKLNTGIFPACIKVTLKRRMCINTQLQRYFKAQQYYFN